MAFVSPLRLFPSALALLCCAALPLAAAPASYNVTDYGAVPDGTTKDTAAFAKAVAACVAAGGGIVFVPAGHYLTGSIRLESNVTLDLASGAELLYSGDPADSPLVPSRWESTTAYTHAPLIYANGAHDVGVTGRGIINGQGKNWWWRTGRNTDPRGASIKPAQEAWLKLFARIEAGEKPGPEEFTLAADYLRPSLVQFYGCNNVLVEGVTLTESPMWMLHPVYSENVEVRGVTFISTGPNGDGIDVDSSRDVRISDCFFSTGDDCIVIKSGRDADGRRVARPTEHIAIDNCVMYKGHGAIVIGSETSGDIRDVAASNIIARGVWTGIRLKSMMGRGGTIEDMRFSNFVIEDAGIQAIEITALYNDNREKAATDHPPLFRNLAFNSLTIVHAKKVATIAGLAGHPIEDLRFNDVDASGAAGFVCDKAAGVDLRDVRVRTENGKSFAFTDTTGLKVDGATPAP